MQHNLTAQAAKQDEEINQHSENSLLCSDPALTLDIFYLKETFTLKFDFIYFSWGKKHIVLSIASHIIFQGTPSSIKLRKNTLKPTSLLIEF